MKQYLPCLAMVAAIGVAGCSMEPVDTGAVAFKKKPKKVIVPEQPAPVPAVWTPPATQLSPEFVRSAAFLLSHGLADPRGGTFSRVYVPLRDRNGSSLFYGWVFSESDGRKRFVGMDGLSRYVPGAGSPQSIDVAIQNPSFVNVPLEAPNIFSSNNLAPTLFLIDGRPDVAAKLMGQNRMPTPGFNDLANQFLRSKWTHALSDFANGDDASALNLVQELASLRAPYEKEAQRVSAGPAAGDGIGLRGMFVASDGPRVAHVSRSGAPSMYQYQVQVPRFTQATLQASAGAAATSKVFNFLDQAPDLAVDLKRRLAEPPDLKQKEAKDSHDVSTTITLFEDATRPNAYGYGNPAYTPGVVQLLNLEKSLEGSESTAVPALIDCIEKDKRFSRDLGQDGIALQVVMVRDLALEAFCELTHTPIPQGDDASRLAEIKKWWIENKNVSKPEREYRVLADDHATPEAWMQAGDIISPQNSGGSPGVTTNQKPTKSEYDSLRDHAAPTVSALLSKRVVQMVKSVSANLANPPKPGQPPTRQSWTFQSVDPAERLCENLWSWDPGSSLSAMQSASDLAYQLCKKQWETGNDQYSDAELLPLLEHRVELNDKTAVKGYSDLLIRGSENFSVNADTFRYYFQHRDDPRFKGFAQTIFLDPVLHPKKVDARVRQFGRLTPLAVRVANSPLLSIPEERQAVLHLLQDKSMIGTIVNDGKNITAKSSDGSVTMGWGNARDDLALAPGQKLDYRRCDQMMENLAGQGSQGLKGAPDFKPYWPVDVKNEIIKKTISLINAHKSDEVALLSWPNNWQASPNSPSGAGGTGGTTGGSPQVVHVVTTLR